MGSWQLHYTSNALCIVGGICEFKSGFKALRAIRILHDMEIMGEKIVLRADLKNTDILESFLGKYLITN